MHVVKRLTIMDPRPVGFTGRGPKGYIRSDARIYEEMCEQLMAHDAIDADDIEVKVERGYISLAGSVATLREKLLIEQLARRVLGVAGVNNRVAVRRMVGTIDVQQRDIW